MKILMIGSGGREHALAWQCAKDDHVTTVYVATGNAGTAIEPKCQNVNLDVSDHASVIHFCQEKSIDLVIVGPEAPLVGGLVDDCKQAGIKIWGPSAYCASLKAQKPLPKNSCKPMASLPPVIRHSLKSSLPRTLLILYPHRS